MSAILQLMTKDEAAAGARICRRSLEKLIADGRGPTVTRVGGRVLIRADHLDLWIRSLAQEPVAA